MSAYTGSPRVWKAHACRLPSHKCGIIHPDHDTRRSSEDAKQGLIALHEDKSIDFSTMAKLARFNVSR